MLNIAILSIISKTVKRYDEFMTQLGEILKQARNKEMKELRKKSLIAASISVNGTSCMKNRSRLDITAEILTAATVGTLKTKIMYSASLSFDQLKEYLTVLVDSGLLEYEAKKKVYETTDKGRDLLTKYGKVKI